jgi:hypothetical protein
VFFSIFTYCQIAMATYVIYMSSATQNNGRETMKNTEKKYHVISKKNRYFSDMTDIKVVSPGGITVDCWTATPVDMLESCMKQANHAAARRNR